MVARNRYDSQHSRSGFVSGDFHVLTRNGMRHVGRNVHPKENKNKASRYGGLYSNQSHQKLRPNYHTKFVNQLKRTQQLEKELKEAKRGNSAKQNPVRTAFKKQKKNKFVRTSNNSNHKSPKLSKKTIAQQNREFEKDLKKACLDLKISMGLYHTETKDIHKDKELTSDEAFDKLLLLHEVKKTCEIVKMNVTITERIIADHHSKWSTLRHLKNKSHVNHHIEKCKTDRKSTQAKHKYHEKNGSNVFYSESIKRDKEYSFMMNELSSQIEMESRHSQHSEHLEEVQNAQNETIEFENETSKIKQSENEDNEEQRPTMSWTSTPKSDASIVSPFENYISFNPTDDPLKSDGQLIEFLNFNHATRHLYSFVDEAAKYVTLASNAQFNIEKSKALHQYVEVIIQRILNERDDSSQWKPFLNTVLDDSKFVFNKVTELHNNAKCIEKERSNVTKWFDQNDQITDDNSTIEKAESDEFQQSLDSNKKQDHHSIDPNLLTKAKNNQKSQLKSAEGADPDPPSSDDDSSSDESKDGHQYKGRRKRTNKHKKHRRGHHRRSNSSSSESEDEDYSYRKIIKNLTRTAKSFDIKPFNIHPDPTTRREKFRTWVLNLKNILSTESKTMNSLGTYPATLEVFDNLTDRIIKTLLFTLTQGFAKQLVSSAPSGHQALIDLKRHCAQTSVIERHNERLKFLNSTQNFGEKASEFLKRIRKQHSQCISIGCADLDNDEVVVTIVLEGLNPHIKAYTATIAELKSTRRRDPTAVSMTDLEEIFFSIDDSLSKRKGERERANYIQNNNRFNNSHSQHHQSKPRYNNNGISSQTKANFIKSKSSHYNKQDLSNITCHFCRQKGHYANRCPQRNNKDEGKNNNTKTVSFESAHLIKEQEEQCKSLLEISQLCHECNDNDEIAMSARGHPRARRRLNLARNEFEQSHGDFAMWLLDSGASSHFTPVFSDLIDPEPTRPTTFVRVADGTLMRATHVGAVELRFMSDQGNTSTLRLLRVLYIPGLQSRLFSIESFVSNGRFTVTYSRFEVVLVLRQSPLLSVTIQLPHVPPGTYVCNEVFDIGADNPYIGFDTNINHHPPMNDEFLEVDGDEEDIHRVNMAQEVSIEENKEKDKIEIEDDLHAKGGEDAPAWKPINWEKDFTRSKHRMNVELGHVIFGHRAVSSLLAASRAKVWDDVEMTFSGDSWCDMCRIAIAPRNKLSKMPMKINLKPLEMLFLDAIPAPGKLQAIKECRNKQFLFVTDPVSKYVEMLPTKDYSAAETIANLSKWRGQMLDKGFKICFVLRTDAGSNFTSKEFAKWCEKEKITLTIAGPKHQEQNAFVERAYQTASRMARSMLVNAHLPIEFYQLALKYACKQLRVLPAKNLVDIDGKPTTTYSILYGKKPRIGRFKVFGCPVVFKRYSPLVNGKASTDFTELQRGCRGVFVGFPDDQAGWLLFVPTKINDSHLVVSSDVVFDQYFLSGFTGSITKYNGSQNERKIGNASTRMKNVTEQTGDITNLTNFEETIWGDNEAITIDHEIQKSKEKEGRESINISNPNYSDSDDDDDSSSSDGFDSSDDEANLGNGTIIRDGRRRSTRRRKKIVNESANHVEIHNKEIIETMEDCEQAFSVLERAAKNEDIDITPYLPEPKNLRQIQQCPTEIRDDWMKAVRKELKFLVDNGTFNKDESPLDGDEIIPAILVYKAKVTSRGFLDKLKARCVARGDLQEKSDPDDVWAPCVFARTFKTFVCQAVNKKRSIKQLDFIGAFCQGKMQRRLFIQLPREFAEHLPEYKEYFENPQLLAKSIYGTDFAHRVFSDDLQEWLLTNQIMPFIASEVDPALFIHRSKDGKEYLFLICYVDDCCYFGSSNEIESKFGDVLKKRFDLELQGHAHWFLGTRIYQDKDNSYTIDQETYAKHILNRFCGKDSPWGLPPMKETPAPVEYVYSKTNRPQNDEERKIIETRFKGLSMASAVSSLLYIALNTRCDILWVVNKLAKSSTVPGIKDFEALMHCFGYLRKFPDYAIKYYADVTESPVYKICKENKIEMTDIIGFSDASWQDCPDTGRSTTGYKLFVQGGIVDSNSSMPVPVALSSAEAEYMGACNLGAMTSHLRELMYEFQFLGTNEYKIDGKFGESPTLLLIDNQATISMSKNYKVTSKNRHIARRWHFVRRGVKDGLFKLCWVPANDQLADDLTKSQIAQKSTPHFERTLIKVPEKVKGFKSNTIGNR